MLVAVAYAGQPRKSRATHEVQEKSLDLILAVMAHRDCLAIVAVEQSEKPLVTQLAAGHFERFAREGTAGADIEVLHIQVYAERGRDILDKALVTVRLLATQVKVAMRRHAVIAKLEQHGEQRH